MQFIGYRLVFEVRRILEGVSGVVGCLHMPVGLEIESVEEFFGQCVRHNL
jgi:hypothetical protein